MTAIEETCCFTGHRPQRLPWGGAEEADACAAFLLYLRTELVRLISVGYRHFVCGMAIGADILFAETVLALKQSFTGITLEAAVPCPEQPDKWTVAQRIRYGAVLDKCDEVTVVSPRYDDDCMMKRNRYMVDKSAVVLAYCRARSGGTAATVRYARRQNKAVINLSDRRSKKCYNKVEKS